METKEDKLLDVMTKLYIHEARKTLSALIEEGAVEKESAELAMEYLSKIKFIPKEVKE